MVTFFRSLMPPVRSGPVRGGQRGGGKGEGGKGRGEGGNFPRAPGLRGPQKGILGRAPKNSQEGIFSQAPKKLWAALGQI